MKLRRMRSAAASLDLTREIVRTYQTWMAVFSREVGVSSATLLLLRQMALLHPRSVGAADLARRLGVDAAAVTRQVQALERERLVSRATDPKDKRRVALKLTEKGSRVVADLHERSHLFEDKLVQGLGRDEIAAATRVLSELRKRLEQVRDTTDET